MAGSARLKDRPTGRQGDAGWPDAGNDGGGDAKQKNDPLHEWFDG